MNFAISPRKVEILRLVHLQQFWRIVRTSLILCISEPTNLYTTVPLRRLGVLSIIYKKIEYLETQSHLEFDTRVLKSYDLSQYYYLKYYSSKIAKPLKSFMNRSQ